MIIKLGLNTTGSVTKNIKKIKMELLPFLFGYIFQGNAGHSIVKRAGPISQTNICINECTGVSDDWTNFSNKGIKVDGNVFLLIKFLLNSLIIKIYNNIIPTL